MTRHATSATAAARLIRKGHNMGEHNITANVRALLLRACVNDKDQVEYIMTNLVPIFQLVRQDAVEAALNAAKDDGSKDELRMSKKQIGKVKPGKCSVPLWSNGASAGTCDMPAYGARPPGKSHWNVATKENHRTDGLYAGYVPGLACPHHGGPKEPQKG